jgi:transcriptional regulator with XRE-family HTH domain
MARSVAQAPDPMDIALGKAIRMRRKEIGASQERLAVACELTFQQVQKYENGSNRVSYSKLRRISEALETTVGDLDRRAREIEGIKLEQPSGEEPEGKIFSPDDLELVGKVRQLDPKGRRVVQAVVRELTAA